MNCSLGWEMGKKHEFKLLKCTLEKEKIYMYKVVKGGMFPPITIRC
jgi:hypothetical protein